MDGTAHSGHFGPMRTRDRGRFRQQELPGGRVLLRIDHDPLEGLTGAQMRWWFENIDGRSTLDPSGWDGPERPVYQLWHPVDHRCASWKRRVPGPDGARIGPGSILHVEECLGGRFPSKSDVRVLRLDESGFDFALGAGTASIGTVRHRYPAGDGGLRMTVELELGVEWPLVGGLFNRLLRRVAITPAFIDAWVVHNIEECGELPRFLPRLASGRS